MFVSGQKNPASDCRVFGNPVGRLEGEVTPKINFGFFRFATASLAGLLMVAAEACFAEGSFAIELFLQTPERFINRLTFF